MRHHPVPELQEERWVVVFNARTGRWSLTPAAGTRDIARGAQDIAAFATRPLAEHIAALHNASLDTPMRARRIAHWLEEFEARDPGHAIGKPRKDTNREEDVFAHGQAVGARLVLRAAGLLDDVRDHMED